MGNDLFFWNKYWFTNRSQFGPLHWYSIMKYFSFLDLELPCDWLGDHLIVLRRHLATGLWGVAAAMFLLTLSVLALLICLCRLNIKYSRIARELAKVKTGTRLMSPVGSYRLFT